MKDGNRKGFIVGQLTMNGYLLRRFYPNYLDSNFFLWSWGTFFRLDFYPMACLFGLVLAWGLLVGEFSLVSLTVRLVMVVCLRRIVVGGICTSKKRLVGQTVIITGANVGIGKETARDMLQRGARVILACRDIEKAETVCKELRQESSKVEIRKLDLSSLHSVRDFANGIIKDNIKVHILINNAGVMMCPYTETSEGFELQMGTNHLGHFLLTNLILPQMKHGQPARIVNVSSTAHYRGKINFEDFLSKKNYVKSEAYDNSKLANILFTRQLAKHLNGSNIQVFAVHPGLVQTAVARHIAPQFVMDSFFFLLKTAMEGAQTTIHCATDGKQHPCMYFCDCAVGWPQDDAVDDDIADELWKLSAVLVNMKKPHS